MIKKIKLELRSLTDQQVIDLCRLIASQMALNAAKFTAPKPPTAQLNSDADSMEQLMLQRAALDQQSQALTLKIRSARLIVENDLGSEADYVESLIEDLPPEQAAALAKDAAMDLAADTGTAVGDMPKVEGLTTTQGDTDGEIDLSWNPVKRGLQNYLVEITDDPAGQTGWHFCMNSRKSSCTVTGLTSAKRYWFRVTAEGAAGPGPASEARTKVAP